MKLRPDPSLKEKKSEGRRDMVLNKAFSSYYRRVDKKMLSKPTKHNKRMREKENRGKRRNRAQTLKSETKAASYFLTFMISWLR